MKKSTKYIFFAVFIVNMCVMNELFAQDASSFEKEIEGIWTVETMPFVNTKKALKAQDIFALQKEAVYTLTVDEIGLNISIVFKDGTAFSGVVLTEMGKSEDALLNISWKIGTDKKLLQKYGLTDGILAEKPTQAGAKFKIKLSILESFKKNNKLLTFQLGM